MRIVKLEVMLTVHRGTLMNQNQLDTLFLVCLLRVNASVFRALNAHLQEAVHSYCLV
jgi:hypothetical protein